MKTKELIKRLQEADPSGEEEVTVGNTDIMFVQNLPSYYDGCQQVLIRDEKEKYYNVVGGKVRANDRKITINLHSLKDAIYENPELPIEYDSWHSNSSYKKSHKNTRKLARDIDYKLGLENFITFVKNRVPAMMEEKINKSAKEFYDRNFKNKFREEPPSYETEEEDKIGVYASRYDREQTFWNENIIVHIDFNKEVIIEMLDE